MAVADDQATVGCLRDDEVHSVPKVLRLLGLQAPAQRVGLRQIGEAAVAQET